MASNSASVSVLVSNGEHQPETSSRCFTESFTATHNFQLDNYPLLDGLGVDKYVSSSVFSVGGCDWTIRYYPDGEKDDGFASAFLFCVSEVNKDVKTKFTLDMFEIDRKVKITNQGVTDHVFPLAGSSSWGYSKFVEKSKLKSLSKFKTGFLIRCVLTVIHAPRTEEVKRSLSVVPTPNLQDHLGQMLKAGQGVHVTFTVSDRLFNAHRYLLAARSPVFKAELFGPMKEKAIIKIDDIEPSIFEALLHFVYTDFLLDDEHCKKGRIAKFQHLLVAADRYELERLKLLSESKLCVGIDMETVATTLALADQHHCKDLKEACIEFMASRNVLPAIMATDGFKHLVESCPFVMIELLDMVCRNG